MKNSNRLMDELRKKSMSIKKFLYYYCGISGESLKNINLSHSDIKLLMPDLKRVSYEYVLNNMSELYVGNIICVIDSYNNIAPYITPVLCETECFINVEKNTNDNDKKITNIILSEDLTIYELSILCKQYKRLGRMKEYRIAHDILKSKKSPVKQYKKEKELLKMEEV